jgi:hypothetical protein
MGRFGWLSPKRFLRDRDQLTVELAEQGIAPEDEKHWTEEQVAKHHHPDPPDAESGDSPRDDQA